MPERDEVRMFAVAGDWVGWRGWCGLKCLCAYIVSVCLPRPMSPNCPTDGFKLWRTTGLEIEKGSETLVGGTCSSVGCLDWCCLLRAFVCNLWIWPAEWAFACHYCCGNFTIIKPDVPHQGKLNQERMPLAVRHTRGDTRRYHQQHIVLVNKRHHIHPNFESHYPQFIFLGTMRHVQAIHVSACACRRNKIPLQKWRPLARIDMSIDANIGHAGVTSARSIYCIYSTTKVQDKYRPLNYLLLHNSFIPARIWYAGPLWSLAFSCWE